MDASLKDICGRPPLFVPASIRDTWKAYSGGDILVVVSLISARLDPVCAKANFIHFVRREDIRFRLPRERKQLSRYLFNTVEESASICKARERRTYDFRSIAHTETVRRCVCLEITWSIRTSPWSTACMVMGSFLWLLETFSLLRKLSYHCDNPRRRNKLLFLNITNETPARQSKTSRCRDPSVRPRFKGQPRFREPRPAREVRPRRIRCFAITCPQVSRRRRRCPAIERERSAVQSGLAILFQRK